MRVRILDVREGAPTRVRFDFARPLAESRLYAWSGRALAPLPAPEIGRWMRLAPASAL